MPTPESIASALARGLIEGLLGKGEPKDTALLPPVIPMDSVRSAVREVLEPLLADEMAQEAPTASQLDLFTQSMEYQEPDEMAERIRIKVAEAQARGERSEQDLEDGTYDPNEPGNAKPWVSPRRIE